MTFAERLFSVLLGCCRIIAGMIIGHAGLQLIRGEGLFAAVDFAGAGTGLFTMIIGLYCISRGILSILPENIKTRYFSLDE